jgi:hypothetical protein
MTVARHLHGIAVGCIRCGERARWLVLSFPMCDACKAQGDASSTQQEAER